MAIGVIAHDNPVTGKVLHLVINQAIHIPHPDHHLLCPMQCGVNDVIVDNLPTFLSTDPTDKMHALTILDPYDALQIITPPLGLNNGVFSFLNVRNLLQKIMTWDSLPTHT